MAVITGSLPQSAPSGSSLLTPTTNLIAYAGNFVDIRLYDPNVSSGSGGGGGTDPVTIYRGIIGGEFVFSEGSPPGGATSVVIIGYR